MNAVSEHAVSITPACCAFEISEPCYRYSPVTAIEQFPLGQGLGEIYYGIFATELEPLQVLATGIVLAIESPQDL